MKMDSVVNSNIKYESADNSCFFSIEESLALCEKEFDIIKNLFEITCSTIYQYDNFNLDLYEYHVKLKKLYELTEVLLRAKSYAEFVDEVVSVQNIYKNQVKRLKNLQKTKSELSKFFGIFYDSIEWFILSYQHAKWKSKERFFTKIDNLPKLFFWLKPWIDIAEGSDMSWESALERSFEAIDGPSIPNEKRIYV